MNWILALVSAALFILSYPPVNWFWLALVAPAPLMIAAARESRWKHRFLLGAASGAVYWFGICNWIHFTIETHGGMSRTAAWFVFLLFCLAKALQTGIFAVLAGWTMKTRMAVPATAALWVLIEYTHGPMGFTWLLLGNAAIDMELPLRLAPITGVWGISFLLAALSAEIANFATLKRGIRGLGLVLWPLLFLLPAVPSAQPARDRAGLVQPNIDETMNWTQEMYTHLLERLQVLSYEAMENGNPRPNLLIWPEAPAPFYDTDPAFMQYLTNTARLARVPFLAGLISHDRQGHMFNSAMLIAPDGSITSRYDKINLVPFGEFVPWPLGPITFKISTEISDFTRGTNQVVSKVDGHSLATFICYESVFPGLIRGFVNRGAEVLFNPSNDGWFGKTPARLQHLRIVRMRAVENRRWILRATNDGLSAAIDPAGRIVQEMPAYVEKSMAMPFSFESGLTVYTRFGDWFVLMCLALSLVALVGQIANLRRIGNPPPRT